jgi:hypothetical protein
MFKEVDLQKALDAGTSRRKFGLWAREASFDRKDETLNLQMAAGWALSIPRRLIPVLHELPIESLADLKLSPDGGLLHLARYDIHMSVEALVGFLVPPSAAFRQIGKLGGRVSSDAKRVSSRANGARGGRPRKVTISD